MVLGGMVSPSNSVCHGPVCSSSMMSSLFSSARATWRGALAVSDMSHKNCDRMEPNLCNAKKVKLRSCR